MLDADVALEDRVVVVRHVAGRVDPVDVGAAVLVHQDAVVELHVRPHQQIDVRLDPEAHHDEVTLDGPPLGGHHALHTPSALERGHAILEDQLDPLVAVDPGHHLADLEAEHPLKGSSHAVDRRHLEPPATQRGSNL